MSQQVTKRAGAPSGTFTVQVADGSFTFDDTTNLTLTVSDSAAANLVQHPYLQLVGGAGSFTAPPLVEQVALVNGVLSKGAQGGYVDVAAGLNPRQRVANALRHDVRGMADKLMTSTVLASPPTFTLGDGTTTIAGSTLLDHSNVNFRYTCGPTVVSGNYRAARPAATTPNTAQTTAGTYPFRVEWTDDAPIFEIRTRPRATTRWRLWIDGTPHVVAPVAFSITDDTDRLMKIDFGGVRQARNFVLEMSGEGFFGGIRHTSSDTLSKPTRQSGPRALIIADSYGVGISGVGNEALSGYPSIAMRQVGIEDCWISGSAGGTGFTANSSGAGATYDQRFAPDIAPYAPTNAPLLCFVQASINDVSLGSTPAQVATAANAYLTKLMAQFPNAFVILASQQYAAPPTAFTASLVPYSAALAPVAASLGIPYIDSCGAVGAGPIWFNGTVYRNSDGTHPTLGGHAYLGRLMAGAIERALNGEMVIA